MIFIAVMLLGIFACWIVAAVQIARGGLTARYLLSTVVCLCLLGTVLLGYVYWLYLA